MNSVVSDLKKELEKSIEQKSDLLLDNTECLYLKEYIDELEKNIDKAIEYIEKHKEIRRHYGPDRSPELELINAPDYITTHIAGYYELLNILKGETNENKEEN